MSQIHPSVVVPQRSRIDDALGSFDQHRFAPRTSDVCCLGHEDTLIGITPENIELAFVVTDARSPYTIAVLRSRIGMRSQRPRYGSSHDGPVHQILGV